MREREIINREGEFVPATETSSQEGLLKLRRRRSNSSFDEEEYGDASASAAAAAAGGAKPFSTPIFSSLFSSHRSPIILMPLIIVFKIFHIIK